jgi:hypothetical protein
MVWRNNRRRLVLKRRYQTSVEKFWILPLTEWLEVQILYSLWRVPDAKNCTDDDYTELSLETRDVKSRPDDLIWPVNFNADGNWTFFNYVHLHYKCNFINCKINITLKKEQFWKLFCPVFLNIFKILNNVTSFFYMNKRHLYTEHLQFYIDTATFFF